MSQATSLVTAVSLPPPVQPATPTRDQDSLSMVKQELGDETKDLQAKRERPPVSLTLANSPVHFGTSELATPPATATSETMEIPAPGKQVYEVASPSTSTAATASPAENPEESGIKSPPSTDEQSDASAKSYASSTVRIAPAPSLKRTLSEASFDEDANSAENAKKGRRNGKMFQCTGFGDCKMCFTRSEHLARHIRKHTGERPFECKCGRAFSRLDNLRQHIYTVHASEPQNYQTIKQCLPVHIPKKKENKSAVSIAPPQPVAVLPGMSQVFQMGPGMAPGMAPMMMPAPNGMGTQTAPMVHTPPTMQGQQAMVQLPCQPHTQQQIQPMTVPVGYQMPAGVKPGAEAATHLPETPAAAPSNAQSSQSSPSQSAQLPVVHYYPQHAAAQPPALVYMGDVPQMYYLPQQQMQQMQQVPLMPQYMTHYGCPMHVGYPQASPGLVMKGAQPLSPPISHTTSPQVHMAPLPQ